MTGIGRAWLALLAAAVFHLWDGRVLVVTEWMRHGEEYVVTLADGSTRILRQPEVRAVRPARQVPAGPPARRPPAR